MPNVSRPLGARPVMYFGGAMYTGAARLYHIPASDATALTIGDLVKLTGNGDANGVPSITRYAANTDLMIGSIVGFLPDRLYENQIFRTASTLRYVFVADDPNLVYEVQANAAFAATTDPGLNVGVTFTAVSTATGLSNMQLDMATKATTSTLPFRIVGLKQSVENDITDTSNMKVLVAVNNSQAKVGATGL